MVRTGRVFSTAEWQTMNTINVAILGASGYTGAELLRLLLPHPFVRLAALTAERNAGQPVAVVLPHLAERGLPDLCRIGEVDFDKVDLVFCALPHGTTQEVIANLPARVRIVDLSVDFRFKDVKTYETWYGQPHRAAHLQPEAVYGLTEIERAKIKKARLVANPGCYPTAAQLPLLPLLKAGLIEADGIIIDAKSGASGAGRALKEGNLFSEVAEGFQAYGVASHRHTPEIEQGLGEAAGKDVVVNFTPHLLPMNRGIFESIYVRLAKGADVASLRKAWFEAYKGEPFVQVLNEGHLPSTRQVRGTNVCQMNVVADRLPGRAIILSAIDNLVKGASGQAVQNMNVMFGFEETMGLEQTALFP
jgi:N-acetyl-gamma-glutamyl-phosphate reductase